MKLSLEKIEDSGLWNNFTEESKQGTIFNRTEYFEMFSKKIDLWFFCKNSNPVLAVPIIKNEALPFSYYQGPMLSKHINHLEGLKKIERTNNILSFAIEKLSKEYKNIIFSLHWSLSDIRPFIWHNQSKNTLKPFLIKPRYTAIIQCKNFDAFLHTIRRDRKQDLKYATKNLIQVKKSKDGTNILNLYIQTIKEKNSKINEEDKETLTKIIKLIEQNDLGFILKAYYKNKLIAAQLVLEDTFYSHGIVLVGAKKSNNLGVKTLLTLEWIKDAMEKGLIVDFNGANSPNLADFKHSMGAEPKIFFNTVLK